MSDQKVVSVMGRVGTDNSTWTLHDMLEHVRLTHPDEEVKRAIVLVDTNDGRGFLYTVNVTKPEILWMVKHLELHLLHEDD